MSLLGAETVLIDQWLDDTLKVFTPLTDLVADRIYSELAPASAEFPYVIYQPQTPPRVVRGLGLAVVMVDCIYTVKAVGQSDSYTVLAPVANAILRAIQTGEYQTVPDGYVFTCVYEQQVMYTEGTGQEQARHIGGEYHIQAQAAE